MLSLVSPRTRIHVQTESVDILGTELRVSRVALGTWAMGGWMWPRVCACHRFLRLLVQGGDSLDWVAIGGLAAQDAGDAQTAKRYGAEAGDGHRVRSLDTSKRDLASEVHGLTTLRQT